MPRRTRPKKERRPQADRRAPKEVRTAFKQTLREVRRAEKKMSGTKASRYKANQLAGLVKPDALCHGNPNRDPKYAFITEEKAAQALANARQNHEARGAEKVEDRYYACPYGTASLVPFNARVDLSDIVEHFHLTSQPARADDEEQS